MTWSHHTQPTLAPKGERGETLLELMATVVLMGISIVALVGALLGAIQTSAHNRQVVQASNEAVNVVESIRSEKYVPCATTATYPVPTAPRDYTYTVTSVQWLVDASADAAAWTPAGGACSVATDTGAQKITIEVRAAGPWGTKRYLSLIKRAKACPGALSSDPDAC